MDVVRLDLPEVIELKPAKHGDERGFFSETYNTRRFEEAGIDVAFVQDNQSFSAAQGVLRGLHLQTPPYAQDKLVRVTKGRILDVAVDVRHGSPRFGKWVARELSAEAWNQLFVPKGFAHGFLTLEPNTEVIYKVSDFYSPEHEVSIAYNDPDIGIAWPLDGAQPVLSKKDAEAAALKDLPVIFRYDEGGVIA